MQKETPLPAYEDEDDENEDEDEEKDEEDEDEMLKRAIAMSLEEQ